MSKSLKNLASMALVIAMILTCICFAAVPASAAISSGTTIYFDNSITNWSEVYVYGWASGLNGTEKMTQIDGTNYWSYTFSSGYSENQFLFKNTSDTWDKQTSNVDTSDISDNANCAVPLSGDNMTSVTWTKYDPSGSVETQPTQATEESQVTQPATQEFNSVGLIGVINGNGDWNSESYELSYTDGMWSIELEFTGGENNFKARANDAWNVSFGSGGTGTDSNYTTSLIGTYRISIQDGASDGTALTVESVGGDTTEPTIPTDPTESTEPSDPTSSTEPVSTTTLYLRPNSNWFEDNARFAAYFYNDYGNTWVSMNTVDGEDNLYSVAVPEGEWSAVIFCRMNPGTTGNNWDNKWNQTGDLMFDSITGNCYEVAEGTWDNGGGTWTTYTPVQPTEPVTDPETDPTLPSYTVTLYENDTDTATKTLTVEQGGVAVAEAAQVEGKTFSHWEENGKAISYSSRYGFYVYSDRTLKAVYVYEEVEPKSTINVTNKYAATIGSRNCVVFEVSRDIDTAYTVVEHGILYGTKAVTFGNGQADEALQFADENGTTLKTNVKKTSQTSNLHRGVYTLRCGIGTAYDGIVYARGYVIVEDEFGVRSIIYSDVESGSFNSLSQ